MTIPIKKAQGKFKDEANSLLITETTSINPKVYSFLYQEIYEFNKIVIQIKKSTERCS